MIVATEETVYSE